MPLSLDQSITCSRGPSSSGTFAAPASVEEDHLEGTSFEGTNAIDGSSDRDAVHNLQSIRTEAPNRSSNPSQPRFSSRFFQQINTSFADTGHPHIRSMSLESVSVDEDQADASSGGGSMSGILPENDGMKALREKMHDIHETALSTEDKAKRMHALMVSDYTSFRQRQLQHAVRQPEFRQQKLSASSVSLRKRSSSAASSSSSQASDSCFDVTAEDAETTFWPHAVPSEVRRSDDLDQDEGDDEPIFGCEHYMRNVKVQCSDCQRWYTCRHCHDSVEDHSLVRKNIRFMLCMYCGHPQKAADRCQECEEETASYYCEICKLWDNDASKSIYHCPDCGICRKGEGLGKDYVHCKRCNVCVSINHASDHRCVERATECDCPICGDYMFSSSERVVAMRCGHYIHRKCYDAWMQTSYKCPICSRSAVNMELQWRKMDLCLESQPMPDSYQDTQAWIICNDCTQRCCVPFHWLGNKCRFCDSYNTSQIKLVSSDEALEVEEEVQRAVMAVEAAHANGTIPDGLAPDLLPSHELVGRPRQQTDPPRLHAADMLAQRMSGSADTYIIPSPVTQVDTPPAMSAGPSLLQTQHSPERLPLRRSSDPVQSRRAEVHSTPSQPLPISIRSRSNIDIARMTSAAASAASAAASAQQSSQEGQDDDDDSAWSEAASEDSTTFWGTGLSPPNINLMPTGWTSPRLFASSPASSPTNEDMDQSAEQPPRPGWGINPGTWRLNSPNFFGRTPADTADLDFDEEDGVKEPGTGFPNSWHPSQWHIGSPHEYFFGPSDPPAAGAAENGQEQMAAATAMLPSFPAGWHPSQWRLGSPRFLTGDDERDEAKNREAATAAHSDETNTTNHVRDEVLETEQEGGVWNLNIRPRFLAERFGSFSSGGGVPLSWARAGAQDQHKHGDLPADSGEEEDSDSGTDAMSNDEEDEEAPDEDEEELELPGHR